MTDPVVELEEVTVELGETVALDGVSLAVDSGTLVGLVGPNGAGKTTLLRTVTGAQAATAGTVRVNGDSIGTLSSRAASRRVAAVPQETSLAFDFTVREAVAMGRTPYRSRFAGRDPEDREAVDRALADAEVEALADRPVGEVSGGERRRVLVARALAQETPVLLLDEPTASLDINHQVRTLELVADRVDAGRTAVAAIHDLDLAARYCERLVVLADGDVVATGPPAAVLTESTLEEAFGARTSVTRHPATGTTSVTALPDPPTRELAVHVVGGGAAAARTIHALTTAGIAVSAGALARGDIALAAARAADADTVVVPPATPVDEAAAQAVRRHVIAADATVVADAAVTEGTAPTLRAARQAERLLFLEDTETQGHHPEARAVYEELRERGTVVADPEAAVAAVERTRGRAAGEG